MYLSAFNELCGCEDNMIVCTRTQHTFHSQFQRRFCCTGFCNDGNEEGRDLRLLSDQQLQKHAAALRKFSSQGAVGVVKMHGDVSLGYL